MSIVDDICQEIAESLAEFLVVEFGIEDHEYALSAAKVFVDTDVEPRCRDLLTDTIAACY